MLLIGAIRHSSSGLVVKRIFSFNDETQSYTVNGDKPLSPSSEVLGLMIIGSAIHISKS